MTGLSIHEVTKSFEKVQILKGISLDVSPGQTLAILGPSGCGKSTLLHTIAGIAQPDTGDILWDGASILDVPPHRRNFGLMFQDYALFPHMNVYENIVYGLRTAGWEKSRLDRRYQELHTLFKLQDFGGRDVSFLSGGEQQRVALARSLAPQPRLLMLDEPLGALDRALRESLLEDIPTILRTTQQTTIYVTHDQEEAFALADQIAVMNEGRIIQTGSPKEIYYHPNSPFVAKFLGFTNFIPGQVKREGDGSIIETTLGKWRLDLPYSPGQVLVLIRPDMVNLQPSSKNSLHGKITQNTFKGTSQAITVEINGHTLTFSFSLNADLRPGQEVVLGFDPATTLHIYPATFTE